MINKFGPQIKKLPINSIVCFKRSILSFLFKLSDIFKIKLILFLKKYSRFNKNT